VALGADDPLLFGPRLLAQYEDARTVHHFTDAELASLARSSVEMSRAPLDVRKRLLAGIDDWLVTD
jgi:adenosine deaminase